MSDTDLDLDRLQDMLNAIPAERDGMTIAEVDGYVAALIVCPEMIPPSEWLPGVWGGEHEFADVDEAEATIDVVMEHYNRIARDAELSLAENVVRVAMQLSYYQMLSTVAAENV